MTVKRKAALVAAAGPALRTVPPKLQGAGPIDLLLEPPFSPKGRFYVFHLKVSEGSRRAHINLTIGGSAEPGKRTFDHSDGFRPFVVGYDPEDEIFVFWDASIYEWGDGFKYNRFCYIGVATIYHAMAQGVATEVRKIRKPNVDETVIACRTDEFLKGFEKRVSLNLERVMES